MLLLPRTIWKNVYTHTWPYLELLVLGEVHHAGELGDVAPGVLDADDVLVAGEPDHAGQREVETGVGRDAVEHHGHGTGISHLGVVSLQGSRCHPAWITDKDQVF